MKTWEDWSDFKVNKAVASKLHGEEWWHIRSTVFTMQLMPTGSGGAETRKAPVNYCKKPYDMWPIISDNKISLHFGWEVKDKWSAIGFTWEDRKLGKHPTNHDYCHTNPLRAAAIVFLEMNGVRP
jgi:hypothetical protein